MTNDIIQFILLLVKFQLDKCLMIFLFRKCKDFFLICLFISKISSIKNEKCTF